MPPCGSPRKMLPLNTFIQASPGSTTTAGPSVLLEMMPSLFEVLMLHEDLYRFTQTL